MKKLLSLALIALSGRLHAQDIPHRIDELIRTYAAANKFNGTVLVASHGKVVLAKGYGYRDAEARVASDTNAVFQVASVSKQFTAVMILKLVEEHRLSLSDHLSRFYPGYPRGDSITIEQLLTHTSGIHDYERDEPGLTSATEATLIARFRDKPFDFPPGKGWGYSNSGYTLLAFIIQKVTGMTYESALRQYIFAPLGMTHSGFDFVHVPASERAVGYSVLNDSVHTRSYIADSSVTIGAGSIYSTVGDLYKWHRGLQDHRIVGRELMEQAYTPKTVNSGYGVFVDSMFGKRVISHPGGIGGFTTYLARITEDDVVIALLANTERVNMQTIARKIVAILNGQPYRLTVTLETNREVPLPERTLRTYVGSYRDKYSSRVAAVSLENGKLSIRPAPGAPSFVLTPNSETRFSPPRDMASFAIEFTKDASGIVTGLMFDDVGNITTFIRTHE